MPSRNILIKNTFWLGLVEVVSKLIMFGVTVSLVRYLGPKEFGSYNLAVSYVAMFMIISDLGLSTVAVRTISKFKDQTEDYLANLLGIKISLSLLVIILVVLSFFIVPSSTAKNIILAVLIYNIIQNIDTVFGTIFSSWERMEFVFLNRLSYYLGILLSTILVIYLHGDVLDFVLAYSFTTIITVIFSTLLIRKLNIHIKISFDKTSWIRIFKETIPFIGLTVVGVIYANSDTLLIGHYFGREQVGLYQSAYKILFAFQSINFINNAIFPRLNILFHENEFESLKKLIKQIILISICILIPLTLLITLQRTRIVSLIYGAAYLSAAPAMALLVWSGVINYFRVFTSNLLVSQNKQNLVFYSLTFGTFVNLIVNFFVMPHFNFTIAAWCMVLSESVILALTILLSKAWSFYKR